MLVLENNSLCMATYSNDYSADGYVQYNYISLSV